MLTLFVQGMKGLVVLKHFPQKFHSLIQEVKIGIDKKIINDYSLEISLFCKKNNISSFIFNGSKSFDSEYAIAIGWQRLINYSEKQFLIVFHDSILPRLRGFNPLVTSLINGDKKVGVTALFASEEYDKGDIIDFEQVKIEYPIKIEKAISEVSQCYSVLANKLIYLIANKKEIIGEAQNEEDATYSLWRDDDDYSIDWRDDAVHICRFIDAVGFPYKGAKTYMGEKLITILDTESQPDVVIENRLEGKVIFKIENKPVIVCGTGLLRIKEAVDNSGKKIDFSKIFRIKFK